MTTRERLQQLYKDVLYGGYTNAKDSRVAFISDVLARYGKYPEFDKLVDAQVALFCGEISPHKFVTICNSPTHAIRNKLITWYIDHPEEREKGVVAELSREGFLVRKCKHCGALITQRRDRVWVHLDVDESVDEHDYGWVNCSGKEDAVAAPRPLPRKGK